MNNEKNISESVEWNKAMILLLSSLTDENRNEVVPKINNKAKEFKNLLEEQEIYKEVLNLIQEKHWIIAKVEESAAITLHNRVVIDNSDNLNDSERILLGENPRFFENRL